MNARLPVVANHPKRKGARPNPNPADVARVRNQLGLTQDEFGALVYKGYRVVQEWESGGRRMPPDTWELIQIKMKAWDLLKRGRLAPQALLDLGLPLPPAKEKAPAER